MKQDHRSFAAAKPLGMMTGAAVAGAYGGDIGDRIRRFLPMVRRIAWHVHGTGRPGIEIEDLIQSGLVALTECAQRHAGPGEDGFAAYAKMRVRGAMVDPTTGIPVIEPDLARTIGEHISGLIAQRGPGSIPLALIVQPRARRALAALLKLRAPSCLVLSISELPPSQPIEVIDVVGGEQPQPQPPGLPQPEHDESPESMAA
jgi:hypothetical protein